MSVLVEAISVVVLRSAIDAHYPGGVRALERDSPGGTFCTDGYLARAGFLAQKDAEFFASMLEASGLVENVKGTAADFVIVDQNLGPARPCLWLEQGRERDGTPVVWHAVARRGALHVPNGWQPLTNLRIGVAPGRPFGKFVRFLRTEGDLDWFHDRRSGRLLATQRYLIAH